MSTDALALAPRPRAIVAEDEPLLAASLVAELGRLWPELTVEATVGDGQAAVERTLELRPDIVFLDIRMPAMTGLEAAEALAEEWPDDGSPFPLIVFVTAYDQYALAAFERAAFDYLLKPVEPERLGRTCARLRAAVDARLSARAQSPASSPSAEAGARSELESIAGRLRDLLGAPPAAGPALAPLRVIQAGVGAAVHMVPVDDVICFEAADKYVRVLTAGGEHLIRLSLRELLPRLDASRFWQVHRGTVVRADAIARAVRDEAGKVTLELKGRPERLPVSRLHAQLFKAM